MIIDSHCHIYPRKIAGRAVESIDRFYGGMADGCHLDGTAETLLLNGRVAGISRFIVHSVATAPEQARSICAFIAQSVEASKGAFTGLGALHPDSEDLEGDFQYLLALGLKGVKLHPDFQKFEADSPRACRIYELCEENEVPVLVHTGDFRYNYSNPERIARVLRDFPRLTLIGAHLGGWSVWDRALSALPDFPNIRVDTSSSFPWLSEEKAEEIIRAFGPERVLFGTDYPMWDPRKDLEYFDRLSFTEDEREMIFWRNCADIYQMTTGGKEEKVHVS
ncbi:MAG: amidohydrolase family protein [Lachnospiraceae bacterium]|nr:amidohydrolase family protein [Lachnospiraceae bacterium]